MKKIITILLVLTAVLFGAINYRTSAKLFPNSGSTGQGKMAATTGSPADGQSCSKMNCHNDHAAINMSGILTSDIPGTGWVAGTQYTLTASITKPGHDRFGFEATCQQGTSKTTVGTLGNVNAAITKLITYSNSTEIYVVHKDSTVTIFPSGTGTYSFHWTAPTAGTGAVTFYVACNVTNHNWHDTGDSIFLSNMTVNEAGVGIQEAMKNDFEFSVFPNPVANEIYVSDLTGQPGTFSLFNSFGEICWQHINLRGNFSIPVAAIPAGTYLLRCEKNGLNVTRKILVIH